MTDTTADVSRPGLDESEAYHTLLDLAQRSAEPPLAELLARHVMRVTPAADWPVRRAAMDACLRRLEFAHRDELRVAKRPPAARALGVYRTRRSGSRHRPYETELERLDPIVGSCECPDFLRGSLGLCKHLLAVIEDLAGRPRRFRQALEPGSGPAGPIRPRLTWDPVRPLTGSGEWLARVRIDDGARSTKRANAFAPARRYFRAAGDGTLALKDAFAGRPERRLELVRSLLPLARRHQWRQAALPPLLAAEKDRLERIVSNRAALRRFEVALRSLKRRLYPYQMEGVRQALERGSLLLADDMGLGKTAQAIAVCHALWTAGIVRRGVVIAPASLKAQWLREWKLFTDTPARIVEGGPGERRAAWRKDGPGFLIANYEQVLRDLEQVEAWDPGIVVLDEAQRIKNWATKTAACVKELRPPYRLVLTGTPMENRLTELASILDWVDDMALEPKWRLVPGHTIYADGTRESVGARNLDTLRERLAPCMLRRVRRDVLDQLPPRTDTTIPVELTETQAEEHDALNQPIAALLGIAAKRPLAQKEFLRLMQLLTTQRIIANGLAQLQFNEHWPRIRGTNATPATLKSLDSPKLLELREILPQLVLEQERKVVVFSQWRRMLRLAHWAIEGVLSEAGVGTAFFSGEESQRRRTQNIVDFHDDPQMRVLFATDAGGVGLNLQRASNCCINLELPWNPAVLEQRIGRIYRIGQEQPIDVYNLVSRDCIEERIAALVSDKKALFDGLFDGSSDEIRFERSGSFMESVRMIMKGAHVRPADDEEGATETAQAEERELEAILDTADDLEPAATAPQDQLVEVKPLVAAPAPAAGTAGPQVAAETVQSLLASLEFRSGPGGRVSIHAPPEAAAGLAAVFEGLARMLRAGAGPEAPHERVPGDYTGDPVLGRPLGEFELSTRCAGILEHCGIRTIGALVECSANDLLAHWGFGKTCLREVRRRLAELGLYLRSDPAPAQRHTIPSLLED